jgi:hypothetical protein
VIAVKDSNGHIKLNQLINMTAAGAVTGTFWGALIGLIFLMPLAGAALGAASGTLGGYLTDVGIDDKWMKETAAAIQPGTAALFVLVHEFLQVSHCFRFCLSDPRPVPLFQQQMRHPPETGQAPARVAKSVYECIKCRSTQSSVTAI